VSDISDEKCKSLVQQYQRLAAQDIRFNVPLADACFDDRTKFCANVPPVGFGGARRQARAAPAGRDACGRAGGRPGRAPLPWPAAD
jgi:Golgi apparatus protein 1